MKTILVLVLVVVVGVGCAGKGAVPVMIQQCGDSQKTCQVIETEMIFMEGEIQRLQPQTNKKTKNMVYLITGSLLFPPLLFFMDLGNAEQEEIDAYRQRYIHLLTITSDNQCNLQESRK